MAKTDVDTRKQQRKEELRAYLSNRGKVDYVLDNIEKIEGLDCSSADFQKELAKLKTANEQRIRLLTKYYRYACIKCICCWIIVKHSVIHTTIDNRYT